MSDQQALAVAGDDEGQAVAQREDPGRVLDMIERLATNPDVDVEKLKGLLDLQERMVDRQAEQEFWAAFARMQTELPEIGERGQIVNKGKVVSTYATFEDIQDAVRPVLQEHGFSLSFRFAYDNGSLLTTGILAHESGHKETTTFTAPKDTSGYKNEIQGVGSAHSYGKRYTTIALLNLTTRGQDDDGQGTGRTKPPPEGYESWRADMDSVADEGVDRFRGAWKRSDQAFRDYASQSDKQWLEKMKRKAGRAS